MAEKMRSINESCVTLGEFHFRLAITEVSNNNGNPLAFLTVVHSLAVLSWPQLAK